MNNIFDVIAKYDMTDEEALAYKIACMYNHILRKLFPDMRRCTLVKGDPRKKELFKYAWKLTHDERFKELKPHEYKMYVYAQLKVFKTYIDDGRQALITPNCLVSKKSWNRWALFKQKMEEQRKFQSLEDLGVQMNPVGKVQEALAATKAYFLKRFGRLSRKDIVDALNSKTLMRWVLLKQVCGYYPYLSPVVAEWLHEKKLSIRDYFGHGLDVYKGGVTPETQAFFQREFEYEYEPRQRTDQTDSSGSPYGATAPAHDDAIA